MTSALLRCLVTGLFALGLVVSAGSAAACLYEECPTAGLSDGDATLGFSGSAVAGLVAEGTGAADYAWRLRTPCMLADERAGACSPLDFQDCPEEEGRVIAYYVVQQRPVVRADGTAVTGSVPAGAQPGDELGGWASVREGCIDITPLNPPPSPGEVFSYFQRLPLPALTTQHQPPGNGLSGLPVIFYTDSPTTQTFTVDIRGFSVVIEAAATQYTWHTGDPRRPAITSTDPGRPYPNQTVEHTYRSGTYTAHLTVTWGATFSVNGGAPEEVPGATTTDGPPVTFDVLQARPVLTNPYD